MRAQVQQCSPLHVHTCAGEQAYCVFDELYGTYHCCEHDADGCASGQTAFADPLTNATLDCSPLHPNTCPPGYGCQLAARKQRYQCCGVRAGCPWNSAALLATSGATVRCTTRGACPKGYDCYAPGASGNELSSNVAHP